jgi:DNA-binding CsgD family transcriptional regulator
MLEGTGRMEPEFVGRDKELATLVSALDEARQGRAGCAVVVGQAGIGKTELVTQATGSAAQEDLLVLRGGCYSIPGIDVQSPYGPFMEIIRRIPREAGDAVRARASRWSQPETESAVQKVDPAEERRVEFLGLLADLAAARTVALVLEDMQWADLSSLDLLVFLARNLTTERVLVIATARIGDDLVGEARVAALEHLRRLPGGHWLELPGLSSAEIGTIARSSGATRAQAEEIARLAEGNPLVARDMAEGCLRGGGVAVPDSTRAVIRGRLKELTPAARRLVHAAAVVGVEVDFSFLPELMGGAEEPGVADLDEALQEAISARLVTADGSVCRFRHALEQQAVYEEVPPLERGRWHQRVARILEAAATARGEVPAAVWAQIAAHWAPTGDRASAAAASLRAGMAARAVSAFPEALTHLEKGRQLWRRLPADPPGWEGQQAKVALATAACARWTADLSRGLAILDAAVPAASGGDVALLWERIGRFRRELGDGVGALEAYETALSIPREELGSAAWAQVLAGYAALLMTRVRLTEAREQCVAALQAAGPGPSAPRANALNTLGVVQVLTDDPEGGLRRLEESRAMAVAIGSEEDVVRYVGNKTFALLNLGWTEETVRFALAELDRARHAGVHRSAAVLPALINAVAGMVLLGCWTEALDHITEGLAGRPTPGQAVSLHISAAEIHTLRGDWPAAEAALAAAREGASAAREPELPGHICRIEAELAVWLGDYDRARRAVDKGLAAVSKEDPDSRLQLARVGLRAEADAAITPATAMHSRVTQLEGVAASAAEALTPCPGGHDLGAVHLLACRAEAARSRHKDGAEMWQRVAAGWDEVRWPYPAAYARLRQAEAHARSNRRAAPVVLSAAARMAEELGAAPLREAIAHTARHRKLSLTADAPTQAAPPRATTRYGLTAREVELLKLLTAGQHTKEIADTLKIAERTATTHLSNIYRKLGVDSRRAAVDAAHRLRLLDPDDG